MSTAELGLLLKARDEASGVLKNVQGIALGMGAAFLGAAAVAIKAAADEEVGVTRLAQALHNSGREWDELRGEGVTLGDQIEANIAQMEHMTGFSDGEMRDALSVLIAQTGDVEEAMGRMALAQDFARGTGMDLATASKLMGKVTDENVNVFKKFGLAVEKGTSQTELFAMMQKKFGGQAEAFGKTAAGQMVIFKNQVDNLVEDLGGMLLPVFTEGTKLAIAFVDAIRGSDALKHFGETIGTVAKIAGELFGVLTGTAPDAGAALTKALGPDAAKTIMTAVATLRDTAKAAFEGISKAVTYLQENWDVFAPAFAAVAITVIVPAMIAWSVAAIAAAAATVIALLPVLIPIAAIGAAVALLALAWKNNFGDIQGKVEAVIGFVTGAFTIFQEEGLGGLLKALGGFALEAIANFDRMGHGVVQGLLDGLGGLKDALLGSIGDAFGAIDFWVGPFHITGHGITIQLPTISLPSFGGGGVPPPPPGTPGNATPGGIYGGAQALGGDYLVSRPTWFMAGEAGTERATFTPGGGRSGAGDVHVHLNFHAPVYGLLDFERTVTEVVRKKVLDGGFRGVLASAR